MQPRSVLLSGLVMAAAAFAAMNPGTAEAQGRPAAVVPYSTSFDVNVASGTGTNGYSADAVPANKRLVIEFVSVVVTSQPGDKPSLHLQDSVNGFSRPYWIPLTLTDPAGVAPVDVYRSTQLVKLYHDGNGANGPGAQCMRNSNGFTLTSCHVTVTGYLIDK
jgi:hypothetical protein